MITRIRVMLADDNAAFRSVLRRLLERDPSIEVVAEAADGDEALVLADTHEPDVVLMDVSMPGLDGLSATSVITEHHPETAVVMLSMRNAEREVALALRNGASEYLDKGMPASEILAAVKRQEAPA